MSAKDKKTQRKIDLLELSEGERVKIIEEIKRSLQRSLSEAKLCRSLIQCNTVVVNGRVVFSAESPLEGLSIYIK
ncbi:MAG: hypothetical protein QW510_00725 [Candidatus Bathyarchaeia archaeon]